MKIFFIIFIIISFQTVYSNNEKSFVDILKDNDKKREKEVVIKNENNFNFSKIVKKLNSKKYTDDVKLQIFNNYYNKSIRNIKKLDVNDVIDALIPDKIKNILLLSKKIKYKRDIKYRTYEKLKSHFLTSDCVGCVEKSAMVGRDFKISMKVSNIVKYDLLNTYYVTPNYNIGNQSYAFLESSSEVELFGLEEDVVFNCNTSYHEEHKTYIFWHCQVMSVAGNKIKDVVNQQKYKQTKACMPIKDIQKKLRFSSVDVGEIDGKFGQKLFFGLLDFQMKNNLARTGRLDDKTCGLLKNVILPQERSLNSLDTNENLLRDYKRDRPSWSYPRNN